MRARMKRGFWNSNVTRLVVIWGFLLILSLLGYAISGSLASAVPDSWSTTRSVRIPAFGVTAVPVLRPLAAVVLGIIGQGIYAFFQPFALCALVLLYYDIRVTKEGMDIQMMLDHAEWDTK